MIDINSKKLVYDQVIDFCDKNGIRIKDLHKEIGITDVGFRKTWSKKNPKSIETLNKIIKFMRKYGN